MPILDLTDEELQGLVMICANGSGPGISWALTNAILTKAQQAAQAHKASQVPAGPDFRPDGAHHPLLGEGDPVFNPPPPTGKGARR